REVRNPDAAMTEFAVWRISLRRVASLGGSSPPLMVRTALGRLTCPVTPVIHRPHLPCDCTENVNVLRDRV
ncbi:MAG: hypothetical protein QOE20_5025, partial [Mycobacterium sp.]|nr:hypothetical protein [Mycobacterium sp.]